MKVSQERYLSLLFLHLHLAVPADEVCRRPRPGVLFALRTGVLCLTCGFAFSLFLIEREGLPLQLKSGCKQCLGGTVKPSAIHDVVCHPLPCRFSSCLAGVGGHQADPHHVRCPLFIVIRSSPHFAEVSLPTVHHLMHERT